VPLVAPPPAIVLVGSVIWMSEMGWSHHVCEYSGIPTFAEEKVGQTRPPV
jgi:hypothetical protein